MSLKRLVFDEETDGFLEGVTKIHVIRMIDRDTGKRLRFTNYDTYADGTLVRSDGDIAKARDILAAADVIYSANGIKYDEPVLDKLYGPFRSKFHFDARVASAVIWTDLKDVDFGLLRKGKLPEEFQKKGLIGRNSVEAWGYRLGLHKGDFDPKDFGYTWATVPFLKEMDDYCALDCEVLLAWLEKIESKNYSEECLTLEMEVARIIAQQERNGFAFDVPAAEKLQATLQKKRHELETALQGIFPPWEVVTKRAISKVNNKKLGRVKGEEYVVKKTMLFNPGSRDHIADRLQKLRGWRPSEFTPGGKPKVDDEILSALPYPEAKQLSEFFTIEKRLGQLENFLKHVKDDGRIHGTVNSNGTVTGRMSHASPNVGQTDKDPSMRSLFFAPEPLVLVGCDAEGLELRGLGHYMAPYDGGAYADAVVNGDKDKGTDVHTLNQKALGLNNRGSPGAKTFIYALIYGAGDFKLGQIVYDDMTDAQKAKFNAMPGEREKNLTLLGRARRARLMKNLPALARLTDAVKAAAKKRGTLRGLDGRLLHVRGQHSALNTLLQSAGAVAMKKALVILDAQLPENTRFVANVHDEWQMETTPEQAELVGRIAADAIRLAGEHFGLKCPLAGSYDVGPNWAHTH
jgi:DNA polymerase I-like protein with 3'-5' exonuclease and polymerase domains